MANSFKKFLTKIARTLFNEDWVYDKLLQKSLSDRKLMAYYRESKSSQIKTGPKTLIFMADGKTIHGGITDRFKGMVSTFLFAQENQMDFKIFHFFPFSLQNILLPNEIQWVVSDKELSFDSTLAKPVLLYHYDFNNKKALARQTSSIHQQFHVYSCVDFTEENFGIFFKKLFKPAPLLQGEIDHYLSLLGSKYISISFRLQNLLGDFKEWQFKPLSSPQKKRRSTK